MSKKKKFANGILLHGIADKGNAVGRTQEGEIIFVEGAVPGDVVDVMLLRKKKGVAFGVVTNIVKPSPHRIDPFCQHFDECGGCKWQNLDYSIQCQQKTTIVTDSMVRIGRLDPSLVLPIAAAFDQKYYRNKLEFSFSNRRWYTQEEIIDRGELESEPALGFHVSGAFDKILDIKECFLQNDLSNEIRNFVRDFCLENQLSFFNPKEQNGFMRNLIVRNTRHGDWMVIVIVNRKDDKKLKRLLEAMMTSLPFITSLYYVVNTKRNDFILDLDFHLYYGKEFMIENLGPVKYKIGPKSFFQTNPQQAETLFQIVTDFASFKGDENVYDLYTGLGSIALFIASKVKSVTGIEEIPDAIEDAKLNAEFNQITNCTFYAGDVKDILEPSFIEQHGKPDVVITDPPRAGMHQSVIDTLLLLEAPKIIYVSCNPATQARDLGLLKEKYQVGKMRPVDMFPHTHHIENVALLTLRTNEFPLLPER